VFHCSNTVASVAADAGSGPCVALSNTFAVNTGFVFCFLIDSKRGIVRPHELRVAVALSAKRRHRGRLRFSDKAGGRILCPLLIGLLLIASMAIDARKHPAAVNVAMHLQHWSRQPAVRKIFVTLNTAIRRCGLLAV